MSSKEEYDDAQDESPAAEESSSLEASIADIDEEILQIRQRFQHLKLERRRLSGLPDPPAQSIQYDDPPDLEPAQGDPGLQSPLADLKHSFKPNIPKWDGQRSSWPAFKARLIYYFRASGLYDALMDPECNDQRAHMVMHVLMSVTGPTTYFNTIETESQRSNAATAWKKLCQRLDPLAQVESDLLRKELENLEQIAGTDVDDYIANLDRLFAKLESLGYKYDENQRINKLIDSVSVEYRELCSRVREERMFDVNAISYDTVCARLRTYQLYNETRAPSRRHPPRRSFPANFSRTRPQIGRAFV